MYDGLRVSCVFQSTPSQRGRRENKSDVETTEDISIHALAKRATSRKSDEDSFAIDFNPRPRKEGDAILTIPRKSYVISIHALAKRATSYSFVNFPALKDFNPRPRKEGDLANYSIQCNFSAISIHALAKRATRLFGIINMRHITFQSTPSQRGRPQIYTMIIYILKLNITFRTFFLYKIIKN